MEAVERQRKSREGKGPLDPSGQTHRGADRSDFAGSHSVCKRLRKDVACVGEPSASEEGQSTSLAESPGSSRRSIADTLFPGAAPESDLSDGTEPVSSGRSKRCAFDKPCEETFGCVSATELLKGGVPGEDTATNTASIQPPIHPEAQLTPLQRQLVARLSRRLSPCAAVVVTNPLVQGNPIVWVTAAWEAVCEFSYAEAVGRHIGRMMQGAQTDADAVAGMRSALSAHHPFKAQVLNYKGNTRSPFWNFLSVTPLLHQGELQLYVANVQDYSDHIAQLSRLAPSQFCKAAVAHRRAARLSTRNTGGSPGEPSPNLAPCPLAPVSPALLLQPRRYLNLAKPMVLEADENWPLPPPPDDDRPVPPIRRLGWDRLELEPEHLVERVRDALAAVGAEVPHVSEVRLSGGRVAPGVGGTRGGGAPEVG